MSVNPLFVEQLVSSQLSDAARVPAMYAYLVNDTRTIDTSVSWDAPAYAQDHPESLSARGGPLGHAWRRARADDVILLGRDEHRRQVTWRAVAAAAAAAARRASRPPDGAEVLPMISGDTVGVVRLGAREHDLAAALSTALELHADGTNVIVAIEAEDSATWTEASLLALSLPRMTIRRDTPALLEAIERSAPAEAILVVRGPDADIAADDLRMLVRAAGHESAVPLWLDSHDGTIAAAGVVVHAGRAYPLLADHPAEDARRLTRPVLSPGLASETYARRIGAPRFPVITVLDATVRAPRRGRVIAAQAYDSSFESDLDAILAPLRMRVAQWDDDGARLVRMPLPPAVVGATAPPSLRWAIKIVSPPGRPGEAWGDTHFARGIAQALRRLGQEVVIDAYDARSRPSAHLDDVILALRGPEPFAPQPGATSLMWIISHPDEITRREVDGFDLVYAASTRWARSASDRFGRRIDPLLQCTDATRFHPVGGPRTDEIVFVGTARGIPRPSVIEPIRAGVLVSVYGPDWRGWIPAHAIKGRAVPNADLPAMYEHASLVLNDHWPAMRDAGFVSNRLYDVVAAGGRAISDDVDGIGEIFDGAVATYRTIPDLLELLERVRSDPSSVFPDESALAAISATVRERDSFDARARTLLDDAMKARAGRG
ncbi:hypothetical protein J2X85_002349 [Microbacterium trichothecenolyticum]|uniref:glycosyltransferase n=1 Tax=Microbacterium trichothecenolyticum TaxID=69370 RepID=UPI00285EECCF|nr:glycosyltransferase [Microbacterium trichothecenolyticum]MDR7185315.1 hypothetical protein [Microbacterium trichothecenolyticum]